MKKSIAICSVCALLLFTGIFWYFHPTHPHFNDRFVIGNTAEAIIERYGKFSKTDWNDDGEFCYAAYMIHDDTPEWVMGYDNSMWYEMYFEDGVVTKVRVQHGWYGG